MDTLYLGKPGSFVALPIPRGGVQATYERRSTVHALAGGGTRVQFQPGGARQYTLGYDSLDYATYQQIEEFYLGHRGTGPYVLLDPGRHNVLTAAQASATSSRGDTIGWTVSGSGQILESDDAVFERGPRSLRWDLTSAAPGSALVTPNAPFTGWQGWPVVAGEPMTWQARLLVGGAATSVTLAAKIRWNDAAGAQVGSLSSTADTPIAAGTWTTLGITGTPPVGAVYAHPRMVAIGASVVAGAKVWIDYPLLAYAAAAPAWAPGSGVSRVSFLSLTDTYPWQAPTFRAGAEATLQEVTA